MIEVQGVPDRLGDDIRLRQRFIVPTPNDLEPLGLKPIVAHIHDETKRLEETPAR